LGQSNKRRGRIARAAILSLGRPSKKKRQEKDKKKGLSHTQEKNIHPSFFSQIEIEEIFCGDYGCRIENYYY